MKALSKTIFIGVAAAALALAQAPNLKDRQSALAASVLPPALRDVGLDQHLNQQVPLYLEFRDESGRAVQLSSYFASKPVILALVYYQCPMLCTQILNGLVTSLRGMSLESGKDFQVIVVSIDPTETPELAQRKKAEYLRRYAKSSEGWHFLTGAEPEIQGLARSIGFRYAYDPQTGQYAHVSMISVLTPQGRISRYFYGVEYSPRDLRLGLVEASENKIGSPVDQLLLYCYHYDPKNGKYSAVILNVVRAGGALTLLILAALLFVLLRQEFRRNAKHASGGMARAR